MSITAIIVNYHTPLLLPPLVEGLKADPMIQQILIVDNSGDFTSGHSDAWMSGIDIITNDTNKGFGAAVNQGVRGAGGQWILVVNPDVRLEEGCLPALLAAAGKYETSLVGPRFYWDDRHLFRIPPATGACFWQDVAANSSRFYRIDADLLSFYWMLRHDRFWTATEPFVEPFLSGACLLVEKKWIDAGGGKLFDDGFYLYYEDTDLSVRAMHSGIRPLCVPDAVAVHYYDQSPSPDRSKLELMAASHYRFQKRYYSPHIPKLEGKLIEDSWIEDWGKISTSPHFHCPQPSYNEKLFLEIGVNSFFFPFTQADITESLFQFPLDIWNRLSPGHYFGRIRGTLSGIREVVQWEK